MALIREWFGRAWGGLVLATAILVGLFAIRQSGKSAGREEVRREVEEGNQQAREVRDEAAAKIDALDDDAVRARARERMRKPAGW